MSELERLKRVVESWVGKARKTKKRRISVYDQDDPLMIITNMGLKMSPEALTSITNDSSKVQDFLVQIHMAEDELGMDLIKDNVEMDPALKPNVYEEEGKILFTVWKGDTEYIVAEFDA